jgi:hypothetical protein
LLFYRIIISFPRSLVQEKACARSRIFLLTQSR